MQSFRIGVEVLLHQLWADGLVPRMLTFEGANVDIYIGISAPLAAWLSTRGRRGMKLAFAWNILGLLALANVVTRSALTAPGPLNLIHAERPNLAIGRFPFVYIPGFFAPLAVMLHVLAIRALRRRMSLAHPAASAESHAKAVIRPSGEGERDITPIIGLSARNQSRGRLVQESPPPSV